LRVVAAVVTLEAPAQSVAGAPVDVVWTGPNHENDFLVIMPATAADGAWRRTVPARLGSPAKLTAPIEAGEAEVRYISGEGHKVLARRPILIRAAEVTMEAPGEAVAGSVVDVNWTGPNHENDFLVIVAKTAGDGVWKRTTYARGGSPAKVMAPIEPGEAEIRYLSGIGHKVLARRPLTIRAAEVTLAAPAEVLAGSKVAVTWTGPNNNNDFLAVTPKSAPDGAWSHTSYTRAGSPLQVQVPMAAGEGEIRYFSGEGSKVLARRPITIVAATITLEAPAGAIAGSEVPVVWTGPNNENDFMAIVPQSAPEGSWSRTSYTRGGSPLKLRAPIEAGPSEIRYYSGLGNKVLARRSIVIQAQELTLDAPAEAVAGGTVSVAWSGQANADDFIAVTLRSAADGSWSRVSYVRGGSPLTVAVPATAGEGEIRYFSGLGHKVLLRRPIRIVPAGK
jgi:Ca-activated chloride channel family protein